MKAFLWCVSVCTILLIKAAQLDGYAAYDTRVRKPRDAATCIACGKSEDCEKGEKKMTCAETEYKDFGDNEKKVWDLVIADAGGSIDKARAKNCLTFEFKAKAGGAKGVIKGCIAATTADADGANTCEAFEKKLKDNADYEFASCNTCAENDCNGAAKPADKKPDEDKNKPDGDKVATTTPASAAVSFSYNTSVFYWVISMVLFKLIL